MAGAIAVPHDYQGLSALVSLLADDHRADSPGDTKSRAPRHEPTPAAASSRMYSTCHPHLASRCSAPFSLDRRACSPGRARQGKVTTALSSARHSPCTRQPPSTPRRAPRSRADLSQPHSLRQQIISLDMPNFPC